MSSGTHDAEMRQVITDRGHARAAFEEAWTDRRPGRRDSAAIRERLNEYLDAIDAVADLRRRREQLSA